MKEIYRLMDFLTEQADRAQDTEKEKFLRTAEYLRELVSYKTRSHMYYTPPGKEIHRENRTPEWYREWQRENEIYMSD